MRSLLSASLVLMLAATASAQFGKNPPVASKPADPPKAADPAAGLPVDPAAAGGAPAAAAGPSPLFAALDLDGDGIISKVEIKKAIVSLKKLDADNDGSITLAECGGGATAAAAGPAGIAAADPAVQWMDRIMTKDKNSDGKLTPNELTENERQMLQGADQNRDGAIDRQELGAMSNANPGYGAQGIGPAVGAANAAGLSANGNGGQGNQVMGRFFQLDQNHDGRLSPDEVPPQLAGMLRGGDLNRDGSIDAAEMQALYQKMGDRMKGLSAGVDPAAGKPGAPANEPNRNKRQKNQN